MDAFVALLLFASLAQTGIFAAAACGKGRLKVNFLQEKILTVPRVTSGSCRYRIRAARGLHVQLKLETFSSESPGLSVFDANVRPFSWRKAKQLPLIETSSSDGTALSFETSVIGIQVDASESTSPLSITYTSVIPSSGSFGYDLEAKRKRQAIRTPGFPRIALPSGVRSRYYIHTSSPSAITITFRRMETSPGDYIDLYDGDAYLGRRSGKMGKKSSNEYDAFSGNLTVYLHTETATTKGFKAFVQLTDKVRPIDTTTDNHEDGPAPRLRCHQRTKVVAQQTTITDQKGEMTCEVGQVCASISINGTTSNFGGSEQDISSVLLTCVPAAACQSGLCDAMSPPSLRLSSKSCKALCCNTDMCNDPELRPTTPTVSTTTFQPEATLTCYDIMAMAVPRVPGYLLNNKTAVTCDPQIYSKCARIDATASGPSGGMTLSFGRCVPASSCDSLDCSSLGPQGTDWKSCLASCCDTDLCNDHPVTKPAATTLPPGLLPSTSEGAIRCYDILSSRSGSMTVLNKKELMTCTDSDARCLRLDARGKGPYGNIITTSYGGCTPAGTCANLDCELLQSTTAGFNLESCRTRCCTDDLCNEDELSPEYEQYSTTLPPGLSPSTSEAPGGIQCYQLLEIRGMGRILPGSEKSPRTCKPGWQCLRVTASASHQSFPSIEMKVAYGTCIPACTNEDACDSIPTANAGVTIKSCEVSCCDTDLCNGTP